MHLRRRVLLGAALVAALVGVPGDGAGAASGPTAVDLSQLQAELAAVTAQAEALGADLQAAAARDGGLRVQVDRLARDQGQARAQLDVRARELYMRTAADPLAGWVRQLAAPGLERLVQRGSAAALEVDRAVLEAVTEQSAEAVALRAQAAAFREQLEARAVDVLAAQDRARALLAEAERLIAEQQLDAALRAQEQARLVAVRTSLDRVSASVTATLTPAPSTPAQAGRSRRAQVAEAPLLALVEAAGPGYPQGYAPTGTVLAGLASWYGPGFVGSPTASGTPYDPERLTCAHKTLPLGTVVRVTSGGRAVSCLVNDRGPYVGDRILDMSRAGSRALGYDGVAAVVVEVLAPVG